MVNYEELESMIDKNVEYAYNEFKKIYESSDTAKDDVELLWRFAKACFSWANSLPKSNQKRKLLLQEGRKYAEHAYELDQGNFEALRWTAILIGSFTEYLGPKQKIEQGKVFKSYLDKAIGLHGDDFTLLHLRGRFAYEVSRLSWFERKVCNTLFSEVPCDTIDNALADFLEAEKYTHFVWSENLLFVSRCYAIKKNKELAIKYLQKAETIECPDEATKEALSEVRSMIAKIK